MFKIYNNFIIPRNLKKSILLIGNFDGLHVGHQKVCKEAKKYKKKYKLKLGVLTFNPLPVMFFNNKIKNYRLINDLQKFILLKKAGVDFVINKRFNLKFSKITSEQFIKNIIVKKIDPKFIFVSNNFRYGNKRKGDVKELITEGKKYGFNIIKPEPLRIKKQVVSSTLIRGLLKKGKIKQVNKLLSRNWVINGAVQRGRRLGKKLGFPTCNIDINNYISAKPGVYSIKVIIDDSKKILNGIAYLGYRPTFGGKKLLLEVNLFGFNGNLYRKTLNVYFCNFIRGDKKYYKPNGQGTMTFSDETRHIGEFKYGLLNGLGTAIYPNGKQYIGQFKGGNYHGQGTLIDSIGNKYIGKYKDNKRNGKGTNIYANGNKYVGEIKDDIKHGQGIYIWANGAKYVGEWKDAKFHGLGTYTFSDGRVVKGIWKKSELIEQH